MAHIPTPAPGVGCNCCVARGDRSWQTAVEVRNVAVAAILAHEAGHYVQYLIEVGQDSSLYTIRHELQPDYLAGVWARSIYEEGLLEPGDVKEVIQVMANAADLPGTLPKSLGLTARKRSERTHSSLATSREGGPMYFLCSSTGRPSSLPVAHLCAGLTAPRCSVASPPYRPSRRAFRAPGQRAHTLWPLRRGPAAAL
jgi:Putative neutral zinc metallopeptidase